MPSSSNHSRKKSNRKRRIPALAAPRLSQYVRALFESGSSEVISSEEISETTGHSAAQVRRDLATFGQFGTPGRGYTVQSLKKSLLEILGIDKAWNVALIGVGNLGSALLGYKGFRQHGFKVVAAFDKEPSKVGSAIEGVPVLPLEKLSQTVKSAHIKMAVLTVPQTAAQEVADLAVKAGVTAVLNFAPVRLSVPASVQVHNIDMAIELERLSFLVTRSNGGNS